MKTKGKKSKFFSAAICKSLITPLLLYAGFYPTFVIADSDLEKMFSRYHVNHIYKGKPVPAKIKGKAQHLFRTMIREGAKDGPNFAGHYSLTTWGCGTGCNMFAIIDSATGDVNFSNIGIDLGSNDNSGFEYRLDSKLLIITGCIGAEEKCGVFKYTMEGKGLKLIDFKRLSTKDFYPE